MNDNSEKKKRIMNFSKLIYEALKNDELGDSEIKHFFDGYKKDDIYKYFSNKGIEKILRSVRINHYFVEALKLFIHIIIKEEDTIETTEKIDKLMDKIKITYITYTEVLFVFFYVIKTRPKLKDISFIEDLYIATDHDLDLTLYKDVNDAILYNTIRLHKDFDFWKKEIEYWEKHKNEYIPNLQLPIVNDENSSIPITGNYERQKRLSKAEKLLLENSITGNCEGERRLSDKKISTKRTALLYDSWIQRLVSGTNIEDAQITRMSIRLIGNEIVEWDGFVPDYTEKEKIECNKLRTKKIVELVLDSNNRRDYYFNKLVNAIIKAQEQCEEDFIKDYLICVEVKEKETNEIYKCIKIDGLLRLLNTIFDGVSKIEKNALGNFGERVSEFSSEHLLSDEEVDNFVENGLYRPERVGVSDPLRRLRKYIYAYIVGEYQDEREKDKEVSISKELLLMMVLVLKVMAPDSYSIDDVKNMIFNSRYDSEIENTLFGRFFINTFNELHENGEWLSIQDRFKVVQEQSSQFEIQLLRNGKTPFADAVLNKETLDGQ